MMEDHDRGRARAGGVRESKSEGERNSSESSARERACGPGATSSRSEHGNANRSYKEPNEEQFVREIEAHLKNKIEGVAVEKAEAKSTGWCARYVREALKAGGINVATTKYAKDYGPKLVEAGFTELNVTEEGYAPRVGDVAVFDPYEGQPNQAGHMQVFTRSGWVSDFLQKDPIWPNSSPTSEWQSQRPAYKIYRYGPWQ